MKANLKNGLLTRHEIGRARPSACNIPSQTHTFGAVSNSDPFGVKDRKFKLQLITLTDTL